MTETAIEGLKFLTKESTATASERQQEARRRIEWSLEQVFMAYPSFAQKKLPDLAERELILKTLIPGSLSNEFPEWVKEAGRRIPIFAENLQQSLLSPQDVSLLDNLGPTDPAKRQQWREALESLLFGARDKNSQQEAIQTLVISYNLPKEIIGLIGQIMTIQPGGDWSGLSGSGGSGHTTGSMGGDDGRRGGDSKNDPDDAAYQAERRRPLIKLAIVAIVLIGFFAPTPWEGPLIKNAADIVGGAVGGGVSLISQMDGGGAAGAGDVAAQRREEYTMWYKIAKNKLSGSPAEQKEWLRDFISNFDFPDRISDTVLADKKLWEKELGSSLSDLHALNQAMKDLNLTPDKLNIDEDGKKAVRLLLELDNTGKTSTEVRKAIQTFLRNSQSKTSR